MAPGRGGPGRSSQAVRDRRCRRLDRRSGDRGSLRERRLPRHHGAGDRDVVRQAQAAFLTSFRGHGGPLGDDLSAYFPEPPDGGSTPIALAQVIPGGHVAASQAIREQIDGARERLDLMNPYVTDADMIGRILAAAQCGVAVRLVVSQTSNNAQATAALKHYYGE